MKLLVADLDGTLFDTRRVNYMAYQEAMSVYGYVIDYQYYCDHCNGRHYSEFLPQITAADTEIIEDIHKKKKENYKKYLSYTIVNQALAELIKVVRPTWHTALVTTASRQNTYEILDKFNMTDLFDLILTSEDVRKTKPDPEGYQKAMQYFMVNAKETLIFEDSKPGIEAANRAGAHCFIVTGYN